MKEDIQKIIARCEMEAVSRHNHEYLINLAAAYQEEETQENKIALLLALKEELS